MFATGGREQEVGGALEHPDPWVRAVGEIFSAGRAENEGDIEAMGEHLASGREQLTAVGDSFALGMSLFLESGRLMLVGDLEAAEGVLEEVREALATLSPDAIGGMIDLRIADVRMRRGDLDGAREFVLRSRLGRDVGRDDLAFIQSVQARIEWLDGDLDAADAELVDALARLDRGPAPLPQSSHGHALVHAIAACVAADRGDFDRRRPAPVGVLHAPRSARRTCRCSPPWRCPPRPWPRRRGEREEAAGLLAAATAIRGAEDSTNPELTRLGLDPPPPPSREAALARLEAYASRAAPVGP